MAASASAPTPPPPPLVEPGRPDGWWEDDPRESARADDRYWDNLYDRDED